MSDVWLFRGLRWSYCLFIATASAASMFSATHEHGHAHFIVVLAAIEIMAVLALMVDMAVFVACIVLVGVYAAAFAISISSGEWLSCPRFIFYAVVAVFIARTKFFLSRA